MRTANRLIRNSSFVLISEIANRLFSIFFLAYAARVLGPGKFGVYALIGTVVFLISYFGDFGLVPMAIREIAKEKAKFEILFNHILSIRMSLIILVYPPLVLAVNLLGYSEEVKYLIYIIGISTVFSTFSGSFRVLYVAFERFKVPSLISILVSFSRSLTNIGVLYLGYGLKGIVLVSLAGSLLGAVISGLWVRKRFFKYTLQLHKRPRVNRSSRLRTAIGLTC